MKYIYDIILNFNERLYEFYEWKDNDNIEYIKKIPIFKVSNNVLMDLKNNKVVMDIEFIKNMYNKCEIYTNTGISTIEYASLFCSDDSIIAIEFNEKGVSIFRSDLLIDEALDILDYVKKLKISNIEYNIVSKNKKLLMTRKEVGMLKFIKKELNIINKKDNIDKLKYIYYECFNKIEDNINKIILDLEKYISNSPNKLFDLLMLSCSKGLQK